MKKIVVLSLTILTIITISAFTITRYKTGASFRTNSPYDANNCTECHQPAATAIPILTFSATPALSMGNMYVSGATYTISVNCSGIYPKYGMDLEILDSDTASANDAGTFGPVVTTNCQVVTIPGRPTNIEHTAPTGTSNKAIFSFTWKAPNNGKICYLYCSCLGVNNNNLNTGDRWKADSLILYPSGMSIININQNISTINIFPNPATDYTSINYILTTKAHTKIELYDFSLKKLCILLNENQNAGAHQQTINLSSMNLKTGIYFISIYTGDKPSVKKLIIKGNSEN